MNYSIDITVATKRDLADAFDYIDGMLMNPSAQNNLPLPGLRGVFFVALFLQFNEVLPLVKRFFEASLAGRAVLCYPMRNFYM